MYNQENYLNTVKSFVHFFKNNASSFLYCKAVTESCICLPIYLKIGVNIKIPSIGAKLHSCLRLDSICFDNILNSFCFQIAHLHITKIYFSFQKGVNNNISFIYSQKENNAC